MEKFLKLTIQEQTEIILTASTNLNIMPAAIEKDYWVCLILNFIFNKSIDKNMYTFKGGTCLSKCYNIIKRFSEDIDIGININRLNPALNKDLFLYKTHQKNKMIKTNREKENQYVKNIFLTQLRKYLFFIMGDKITIEFNELDCTVLVHYPHIFSSPSLLNYVLIEFGSMACMEPNIVVNIKPYIEDFLPENIQTHGFLTKCVSIDLIFWEKFVILYRETQRPMDKLLPSRVSRHYYDLYCILKSININQLLESKYLLKNIIDNELMYYYRAWENINKILTNDFSIVPNNEQMQRLEEDYKFMHPMFFKQEPTFNEIINVIKRYESILIS